MAVNLLGEQGTRILGGWAGPWRKAERTWAVVLQEVGLASPWFSPALYRETKAYHGPRHVNLEGSSENGFPGETRPDKDFLS